MPYVAAQTTSRTFAEWFWYMGLGSLPFVTILLVWMAFRQIGALKRAVLELAERTGRPVAVKPRWYILPRFSLKGLLVLFTIVAIVLGTFGNEVMRARRQQELLDALASESVGMYQNKCQFRTGLLGDGKFAGLFSNWVHSGFGWRLTHLQLGDELDVGRDTLPTRKDFVFDRLREFRDLEGLQLMGVTLSDEMVEGLVSLPRLQRLSLLNCRLPPEAVSRLGGLTPLKELELHHCRIADDDLQRIDNLTNLTTLRLADDTITDEGLLPVCKLPKLRSLSLTGTSISKSGVKSLLSLQALEVLELNQSQLDGDALAPLVELPKLRELRVHASQVKPPSAGEPDRKSLEKLFWERRNIEIDWRSPGAVHVWHLNDNRPQR